MPIDGYVEYQRREYCRDVGCKVQALLDGCESGSEQYEKIRSICTGNCIHTTYEFHHWLIEKGYELVKAAV